MLLKKRTVLFIMIIALPLPCFAVENLWLKSESNSSGRYGNYGESILLAGSDKFIVTSVSKDTIGRNYSPYMTRLISAYDLNGNALWATKTGDFPEEISQSVAINPAGTLMTLKENSIEQYSLDGHLIDTIPFQSTLTCITASKSSYYVGGFCSDTIKLDSLNKDKIRNKSGIKQYDYNNSLINEICFKGKQYGSFFLKAIASSEKSINCIGFLSGKIDTLWTGNSPIEKKSDNDFILIQFDQNGNLKWFIQFPDNFGNEINIASMLVSQDGNLYLCGGFEKKLTIQNKIAQSRGGEDAFVMKIDNTGKIVWLKSWGSDRYDDHCSAISISDNSQILLTGISAESFSGDLKSDVGKAFLLSFDTSGVIRADLLLDGTKRAKGCGITSMEIKLL